jgi:hypothetical protein
MRIFVMLQYDYEVRIKIELNICIKKSKCYLIF